MRSTLQFTTCKYRPAGISGGQIAAASCRAAARSPVREGVRAGADDGGELVRVGVVLEVASVRGGLHHRLVGRRDLLLKQLLPVEPREPLTLLDVVHAVLQVPEALPEVRREELLHEDLRILVKKLWEDDLAA